MKNRTIKEAPSGTTATGYRIYIHSGRILAEGYSRWQGSISGDRLMYVGKNPEEVADCSAEELDYELDLAVYELRGQPLDQVSRGWRMTHKGHTVQ